MNKALSSIPAPNKSCTVAPIPAFRRQRKQRFRVILGYTVFKANTGYMWLFGKTVVSHISGGKDKDTGQESLCDQEFLFMFKHR